MLERKAYGRAINTRMYIFWGLNCYWKLKSYKSPGTDKIPAELIQTRDNKLYGYEVPGTILLRDLKGAMRLHRNRNMTMHITFCNTYDLNALTPVVWDLWRW